MARYEHSECVEARFELRKESAPGQPGKGRRCRSGSATRAIFPVRSRARALRFERRVRAPSLRIDLAKANFDVAKRYDISIDDGAGFSVRDTDAIDMRPVCRTGVGDQQSAEAVHL